jgi:hypothetical protein
MQKELETYKLIAACIEDCIVAGLFNAIDVELFTYQIVMFSHSWALKAWRFHRLMSLDEYVERGLNLMLKSVLTPKGEQVFAQLGRMQGNGAKSLSAVADATQTR